MAEEAGSNQPESGASEAAIPPPQPLSEPLPSKPDPDLFVFIAEQDSSGGSE